jgi:hypothetical protein
MRQAKDRALTLASVSETRLHMGTPDQRLDHGSGTLHHAAYPEGSRRRQAMAAMVWYFAKARRKLAD